MMRQYKLTTILRSYEYDIDEIEAIIRAQTGLTDGVIDWDVSSCGLLRGCTIKTKTEKAE